MENKEKKSINYYIRLLHRYLGFFFVGFVLIYALAGITLVFRDTDFLKKEKTVKELIFPLNKFTNVLSAVSILTSEGN